MRKPVAMTSFASTGGAKHFILCDDGALFQLHRNEWKELPSVPGSKRSIDRERDARSFKAPATGS